ncbi:MAG: hypothetical protein AAF934_05105 [Bacteroidota bacterium]
MSGKPDRTPISPDSYREAIGTTGEGNAQNTTAHQLKPVSFIC